MKRIHFDIDKLTLQTEWLGMTIHLLVLGQYDQSKSAIKV